MSRRSAKNKGNTRSGHPGRGKPKSSPNQKRRAHGEASSVGTPKTGVHQPSLSGVRLNRWLAERGVGSRRGCDTLIQECAVEVNGSIVQEPGYRVQDGDKVSVEGRPIKEVRRLYYLFHKPKGVLCTDDPRESRLRVSDLVEPHVAGRVYTVGRLDEDSEGLLLLTNDGDFSNLIAHPRYEIPKTYVVQLGRAITHEEVRDLRKGVWLSDGKVVPETVKLIRRSSSSSSVEVRLREGRNREIRRMFAKIGYGVKTLKRVRIGSLGLKGLKRGAIRPLTRTERDELVELAHAASNSGQN